MSYPDREDQGGRVPAALMNVFMPGFLVEQAERLRVYFERGQAGSRSSTA